MATDPIVLPTNKDATSIDSATKQIEAILVPVAEAAIIAACPDMALPVVKQITEAIEQGIANYVTKIIETGATFLVIDGQTAVEGSSLSSARATYLRAIVSNDPAAIAAARIAYDQAQSAVARDDGGATPQ